MGRTRRAPHGFPPAFIDEVSHLISQNAGGPMPEPVVPPDPAAPGALFRGETTAVCVESDGRVASAAPAPALLVPGAFNPVHAGHWGLAEVAARLTGTAAAFELSVTNVDKPPLGPDEVR